jgi:hypothetical protein
MKETSIEIGPPAPVFIPIPDHSEPNMCVLFIGIPYLIATQAFKICVQGKEPGKFGAR